MFCFFLHFQTLMAATTTTSKYILYGSARSSCAWRVRAVLEHKCLPYEYRPVAIYSGEQHSAAYRRLNPAQMIPALVVVVVSGEEGKSTTETLHESLAIIDYLERVHPSPSIYPADPLTRARSVAIAEMIVSSIQPVSSFKFMKTYAEANGGNQQAALSFSTQWIAYKFDRLQELIEMYNGGGGKESASRKFVIGNQLSIADICLVPQLYTAARYKVDLGRWPLLNALYEQLLSEEAALFKVRPEAMADFHTTSSFVDNDKQ